MLVFPSLSHRHGQSSDNALFAINVAPNDYYSTLSIQVPYGQSLKVVSIVGATEQLRLLAGRNKGLIGSID